MYLSIQNPINEPRNPNYEKDIAYVTKYNKWVLTCIGIWPIILKNINKILPKIVIGINNLLCSFILIQSALHIIYEEKDVLLRLKILGLIFFSFISLMKYWALTIHKPEIKYCIEQVQSDWKQVEMENDRELMLKYGILGRNLTIYSILFMYMGSITYMSITQYAMGLQFNEHNQTIRVLIYPTYGYNIQKSPIYEIIYGVQFMCGYVVDTITSGACGLAALFVTHACGQIDIITSRLDDIVAGQFYSKNLNPDIRLMGIIKHHIRILKFSAVVETILQEVFFLEFIGSTFVICLLEYYCIADWEQKNIISLTSYVLLLISLTFNMFLLCYIGDLLIQKSSNIGVAVFMIDWFHLPTKTIQNLILIMAMSNTPAKLTVGRIVDLSLSTFGNVLKTTFVYLNFLQTAVMQ
ncbi:odorant receptor 56 [Apis mellifera caucasica]|uniref:Odorant receptor n=1 Tax=Apis mellifera TaxID=7460 RepID=A0A7M6UQ36_APIME|nr:odorant receptor 56 [Apis mellifera]KAG6804488.1 odorant receptor 56 [Apis mellifera caucasica]KAG9435159.1 odorant receptor 56 [Apis mellifera carnica]|eukprot:NP_001229909.1 odorant receptor 56 [Apis mellifera]